MVALHVPALDPADMVQLADNAPLLRRIGRAIAHARVRRGWTQEALAAVLEISVKNVQRLESGRHDLRLSTVAKVAAALGMTLDGLVAAQPDDVLARARPTDGPWSGLAATGWSPVRGTSSGLLSVPVVDLRGGGTVDDWGLPSRVGAATPPAGEPLAFAGLFIARALCATDSSEVASGAWCLFRHPVRRQPGPRTVLIHRSAEQLWSIESVETVPPVEEAGGRWVAEFLGVLEPLKPERSAGKPPYSRKDP